MSVGGINIRVGVGLESFARGLKKGESLLLDFQRKMAKIRLDKAIKGNPFEETNNYMKEARNTLTSVFDSWAKEIRTAGNNMDKFALKSKKSVETIIQQYTEAKQKVDLFRTGVLEGKKGTSSSKFFSGHFKEGELVEGEIKGKVISQLKQIQELAPAYSQAKKQIGKAISNINKGLKINADNLYKYIKEVFGVTKKEYEALDKEFQKGFKQQDVLKYQEDTKQARDVNKIQEKRKEVLKQLRIEELQLRTEIQQGINVDKNKVALVQTLTKMQEFGANTAKRLRIEEYNNYITNLKKAKDVTIAQESQSNSIKKLVIQEKQLATAINAGISIGKNRVALIQTLNKLQELGLNTTKKLKAEEGKKYATELKDTRDVTIAQQNRVNTIKTLILQEKQLVTEINAGINVNQNRIALMQTLTKLQELGVNTTKRLREEETSQYVESIKQAKDVNKIQEKRLNDLRKLKVQETQLRSEIKQGINVDKNKVTLLQTLNKMQELGVNTSKKLKIEEGKGYTTELKKAKDLTVAQQSRVDTIKNLILQEKQLATAISAGISIDKNRITLMQTLTKLQELGINTAKRLKKEEATKYVGDIKQAKDPNRIQRERVELLKKIAIEEARARAEIKAGYNVERNKIALYDTLTQKQKLTTKFTKDAQREYKKLGKEVKASQKVAGGFLSPEWFKERLVWFVQLRLVWAAWRGIGTVTRNVIELEQSLRDLQAITQATTEQLDTMKNTVLDTGKNLGISVNTISEGMVKIGQAGFSIAETNAIVKDTATLATATLGSMETAADLVTTSLRAWDLEAKNSQYVTDILANTVNKSKVTIEDLGTALQYVTGVAPQLNLTFEQTSAMLGILANRGIRLSKAGTGIRALLGELVRPSERFKEEIHKVGLSLENVDVTTRGVIPVLETLSEAGFDAVSAFRGLDRRAASAISALIKGAGGIDKFATSLTRTGTASEMAETRMEALSLKTVQLKNRITALAYGFYEELAPALSLVVDGLSDVVKGISEMEGVARGAYVFVKMLTSALALSGLFVFFSSILVYLAKLKVALAGIGLALSGPGGWAIAGTIAGLSVLIALLTGIRSPLEKYADKLKKANAELSELNKEQSDFNKVQKEYIEAIKEGNRAEATRIAGQNDIVRNIHWQVMAEKDQAKAIKKVNDLLTEQTDKFKELKREQETVIREAGLKVEKTRLSLAEEEISGLLVARPYMTKESREKDEKRAQDKRVEATQQGIDNLKTSILEYVESREGEIVTLKDINAIYGKSIKDLRTFSQGIIDIDKELDTFVGSILLTNKEIKDTETYMKELASKGIPNLFDSSKAVTTWFNKIKSENKDLRDYLKRNPFTESFLGKTFEEDPEKALQSISKVKELLEKTSDTWIAETKDALGLTEKQMKEMGDEQFLNLVATYRTKALSQAIGYDEGKRVRQTQEEGREFAKFIKDYLEKESELKKEINSITEEYLKKQREEVVSAQYLEELHQREVTAKDNAYAKTKERLMLVKEENEIALTDLGRTEEEKDILELERGRKDALEEIQKQAGGVAEVADTLLLTEESINKLYDDRIAKIRIEQENSRKRLIAEKKIEEIAKEISMLELNDPQNKEKINQLQKEQVNITLAMLRSLNKSKMEDKDRLDINKEITDDLIKQIELQEEYLRLTDPIHDAMQRIKAEQKSFNEMMSDFIFTGFTSMSSGLTDFLQEMTGGFQKARQEVVNLEGELTTLYREKDELADQEFLSEEDAERFRELNQEIEDTKNKIDDLEDPLKNAANSFKDFAKSVIDEIRNIINEWIAMQIVTGLFKAVNTFFGSGTGETPTFDPGSNLGAANQLEAFYLTQHANGGILPKIQSMRAFATGGVTNGPNLALLGDNKSGREIIIPTENIHESSVGPAYIRSKDESTVNIINVVTESDLANAMSRPMPGKVVINHVYREQRNKV